MQNRRGLFAREQSGRLSEFVPYKGTKDLPNAGRISRFIRNFVDMKVALCQFSMEWEAAARNLRRAEELVAQAGADLALLPEMFATGFVTEPWPNRAARTRRNSSRGCAAPHDVMRRRWPAALSSAAATVSPIAFSSCGRRAVRSDTTSGIFFLSAAKMRFCSRAGGA